MGNVWGISPCCTKPEEDNDIGPDLKFLSTPLKISAKRVFREKLKTKKAILKSHDYLRNNSMLEIFFDPSNKVISSKEDIRKVYRFYTKAQGSGNFASVRKACLKSSQSYKEFAVKTLINNEETDKETKAMFQKELEILRALDHPNLTKFYESYNDGSFTHFVIDYCEGGDLIDQITEVDGLDEDYAKMLFYQILCAINYIHSRGVCHRDIKPDNFLFVDKAQKHIKLTDFGLSEFFTPDPKNTKKFSAFVGTPWYVAPEVLDTANSYDERVDYWSAGVTLYVMLSGRPPFNKYDDSNKTVFKNIGACKYDHCNGKFWQKYSPEILSIIKRFLVVDPAARLTPFSALSDPYFVKVEKQFLNVGRSMMSKGIVENQRNFRATSRFQKEVIKMMVLLNDNTDQIKNHRYLFFCLDYLSNGVITKVELKAFFEEVKEDVNDEELEKIMESLNLYDKGAITYTEFIAATIEPAFYQEDRYLLEAFRMFDVDENGVIDYNNIKQCFSRQGFKLKDEEIMEMIKDFDMDTDKEISCFEFLIKMKLQGTDKRLGFTKVTTVEIKSCENPHEHAKRFYDKKLKSSNEDVYLSKNSFDECQQEFMIQHGDHVHKGKRYKLLKDIEAEITCKIRNYNSEIIEETE